MRNLAAADWNGLRVEIRAKSLPFPGTGRHSGLDQYRGEPAVHIDPGQLPAIRELWHERLDEPILSVGWWLPLAGSLVMPLAWAKGRWVGKLRGRFDRCLGCGYDLRATPDRCPECGTVPKAVA